MLPVVGGLDKARLMHLTKTIDGWISANKISGASVAIIRRNHTVHESYHGVQDIASGTAVSKDTLFRIYSMTKPVTSIALMMLYERGKFKLTDPVALYIPSLDKRRLPGIYNYAENRTLDTKHLKLDAIATKPIKSQIRIWQLLTHCSGLTYGMDRESVMQPVDKLHASEWM